MPVPLKRLRGTMKKKLGFSEARRSKHIHFKRTHQGQVVGVTHISHGRRDAFDFELGQMAKQLGVTSLQFRGAIDCSVAATAFLQLLVAAANRPA